MLLVVVERNTLQVQEMLLNPLVSLTPPIVDQLTESMDRSGTVRLPNSKRLSDNY